MSRRKSSPVERAFSEYVNMTDSERASLGDRIAGFHAALAPQPIEKAPRKSRVEKAKAKPPATDHHHGNAGSA